MRQKLAEQAPKSTQKPNQADVASASRLALLVRSGLMKTAELPQLRMAMKQQQKVGDVAKLTKQHRDVLSKYNSALSSAALKSQQSTMALRRNLQNSVEFEDKEQISEAALKDEMSPPVMLVLKRKGIRIFPDGRRVALYTNDRLGLVFTIPYTQKGTGPRDVLPGITAEETVFESIKQLAEANEGDSKKVKVGDETVDVRHETAMNIMKLHSKLNDENKKLMQKHINDPAQFKKIASMAAKLK